MRGEVLERLRETDGGMVSREKGRREKGDEWMQARKEEYRKNMGFRMKEGRVENLSKRERGELLKRRDSE